LDDDEPKSKQVSSQQVQAAKEICLACRDVSKSFTPAQLLQGGHEICLHAYRYRIPFYKKKKKKNEDDTNEAPLAVVDVHVSVPNWAFAATTESSLEGLPWLTSNK
jgi:hypothetical protein